MRKLALSYGVFPFLSDYNEDPFVQATNAISVVRQYLDDSDLVMILGKNTPDVQRNNMCCLTRLQNLIYSEEDVSEDKR